MQRLADRLRNEGKRIAVVPTMGYLHQGHLALIGLARHHGDVVVTTVFVNPTQFGPTEDFSRYPRDLERDTRMAFGAGSDYVFAPDMESMYPSDYRSFVHVEQITAVLEGKSRPGHFRGVATVVAKLFNIIKPHVAVFGQKDAQQVVVVQQMVRDLQFDVRIVVAPIVRESDGLAMSSRNTYLSPEQRAQAPVLFESLRLAEKLICKGERNAASVMEQMRRLISGKPGATVDYISIAENKTLEEITECRGSLLISLAVRFGSTRLIDNIILHVDA
jgi:pantoate--beta-alanine ligase